MAPDNYYAGFHWKKKYKWKKERKPFYEGEEKSQGSDVHDVPLWPYWILWQRSHWLQWEYDLAGKKQAELKSIKIILMHCFPFLTLTSSFPFFPSLFFYCCCCSSSTSTEKAVLRQPLKRCLLCWDNAPRPIVRGWS